MPGCLKGAFRSLALNPPVASRWWTWPAARAGRAAPGLTTYLGLGGGCTAIKRHVEDVAGVLNGTVRTLDLDPPVVLRVGSVAWVGKGPLRGPDAQRPDSPPTRHLVAAFTAMKGALRTWPVSSTAR